jgi:pimeloyl-ACP methyl ester carboxylesterase
MWEHLLVPLCQDYGFRCIAPDRRGFGDSEWNGPGTSGSFQSRINFNTFSDDVAFLLETVAVGNFIFVAASMGGGESLLVHERSASVQQHCKACLASNTNEMLQRATL